MSTTCAKKPPCPLDGGARLANSPAEVAAASDITFTSLPGPHEVEAVSLGSDGVLQGIRPGSVYIDLSSSRPTLIPDCEIEPQFRARGGAGRSRQRRQDRRGVGQPGRHGRRRPGLFDRVKPVLDAFGDKVFYAGEVGAGSVAKLVHNMIGHSVRQAIAEGLTLGVKAGVDPEPLWECVRRGALGRMSFLHEGLVRTMFRGEFEPASFALNLAHKDISLATELAREYDVPMPMSTLAQQISLTAMNRGWANADSSSTVRLQEEQAGVEVRAPHVDPERSSRFITTHPDAE